MRKKEGQEGLTDDQIESIAGSVMANAIEIHHNSKDPFETYVYNIQLKTFNSPESLIRRCQNGYHALFSSANGNKIDSKCTE